MILSDFLSRQKHDDSNLHKIIPILFNMQNLLCHSVIDHNAPEIGIFIITLTQAFSNQHTRNWSFPISHLLIILCGLSSWLLSF